MEVPDLFIHPVTGNVFLCPYGVGCVGVFSGGKVSSIEKGVQTGQSFSQSVYINRG